MALSVDAFASDPFSIREIVFAVIPDFAARSRTDHFNLALEISIWNAGNAESGVHLISRHSCVRRRLLA